MRYRSEVDGLRAVAILPVMFFHAGVTAISGGFLGVDIFFVISGYLITSLIERDLEARSFSIFSFYVRRFRRILPALIVMMALTLPLAWALMIPDDLENYGQSLVATALSANNILLYLTQDYFAMEAQFKPLIHTWSLGVEEQYYVAVPLLMSFAFALGKRRAVTGVIAVVTVASLCLCVAIQTHNANANFYLIFSRAWELGAGALVAMNQQALRRTLPTVGGGRALALAGLVLMIAPLFLMRGDMLLPGLPTLFLVIGVCLVLVFATEENAVGRALGWSPLRWIGVLSYSAYLYHQPVFAFIRIARLSEPPMVLLVATIPVIFLISYLSWRFVEQPFRRPKQVSTPATLAFVGFGSATLGAMGLVLYATSGFYANWPELATGDPEFGVAQNISYNKGPYRYYRKAFVADGRRKILVIGNSFARDTINMGVESGALANDQISYYDSSECAPDIQSLLSTPARQADYVIFGSGPLPVSIGCMTNLRRYFYGIGVKHLFIMGTKNFGFNNNAVMLLDPQARYAYRAVPTDNLVAFDKSVQRLFPAGEYVSIFDLIADKTGRVPVFTPAHKFISQDRKHLTKAGAAYIGHIVFAQSPMRVLQKNVARADQPAR